jgi:hypothetical protein
VAMAADTFLAEALAIEEERGIHATGGHWVV